jgi:hypothetical protein
MTAPGSGSRESDPRLHRALTEAPEVTRGPTQRAPFAVTASTPPADDGPLVTGPLGPLVQPGLVNLGERVRLWLEEHWHADGQGSFACPIPGHKGTARLIHYEGDLRLGCCTGRWRSLGEVFAAEAYRRDFKATQIQIAAWTRRLAYEAGTFRPLDVAVPELPPDASDAARRAREGFALLIGLRWRDGEHRPVAFAVRFCSAWCQMGHTSAAEGVHELRARNVIFEADRRGQVLLYLPASREVRR